jgi:ureidoacrylate peracid hydrolase
MHMFAISQAIVERVKARAGKEHPFDVLDPRCTALLVIDLQNYFMKPGAQGEVPLARAIVPAVNRLAAELRRRGGHVVWIRTSTKDTSESWSVFNNCLLTPERSARRYQDMDEAHDGFDFWPELVIEPTDAQIVKKRFSAFIQGSSDIVHHLHEREIDTVLVAGTATNVCCESSARDAMMLNFKTIMIADALATYSDEEHNASLSSFYSIFGDVQRVSEVIQSLDRRPASVKAT